MYSTEYFVRSLVKYASAAGDDSANRRQFGSGQDPLFSKVDEVAINLLER